MLSAILICLVVAGSLLGNSFVAGRMAVAAAQKAWLPRIFGLLGHVGTRVIAQDVPDGASGGWTASATKSSRSDAPINAIVLSTVLSTLYILFGNFRALLMVTGLGEYTFFFLTVLGAIILRYREPGLRRPYKPVVLVPAVFAIVCGFVVVRGAIFAPVQAIILILVWATGLLFYWARKRWARMQALPRESPP